MADEKTSPNPDKTTDQPPVTEQAGTDASATKRKTVRVALSEGNFHDAFHVLLHEGEGDAEYALHLTREFVEVFKADFDEIQNRAAQSGVMLKTDDGEDQ